MPVELVWRRFVEGRRESQIESGPRAAGGSNPSTWHGSTGRMLYPREERQRWSFQTGNWEGRGRSVLFLYRKGCKPETTLGCPIEPLRERLTNCPQIPGQETTWSSITLRRSARVPSNRAEKHERHAERMRTCFGPGVWDQKRADCFKGERV